MKPISGELKKYCKSIRLDLFMNISISEDMWSYVNNNTWDKIFLSIEIINNKYNETIQIQSRNTIVRTS